jgi:hypothetical protein
MTDDACRIIPSCSCPILELESEDRLANQAKSRTTLFKDGCIDLHHPHYLTDHQRQVRRFH